MAVHNSMQDAGFDNCADDNSDQEGTGITDDGRASAEDNK
jgi:hypothetical protein